MNREKWLEKRNKGIGASDAAAILGASNYMSSNDLWQIKTGRLVPEDISDKPYIKYGIEAEKYLRKLFSLNYPEYEVSYNDYDMIYHPEHAFIFATLDGRLIHKETGRKGILEIKTTEIFNPSDWDKWNEQIPQNYYIQVLHQFLATGFDFAILKAEIRWRKDGNLNITTRHYPIERKDCLDDINYLLQEEIKFWSFVENNKRPPTVLPMI